MSNTINEKIHFKKLIALFALLACILTLIISYLNYRRYISSVERSLMILVDTQASLYASIAEADKNHDESIKKILSGLKENYAFMETGEIGIAIKDGDYIKILTPSRFLPTLNPPIHWEKARKRNGVMYHALNKTKGVILTRDNRGQQIIAAYTYVPALEIGVAAKVDYDELLRPMIIATITFFLVSFGVILIGGLSIRKLMLPILNQLQEQKERIQHILSGTPSTIYQCKKEEDWIFKFVGPQFRDLTGHKEDFILNKSLTHYTDLIHSDDLQKYESIIMDRVFHHTPYSIEYRLKNIDGSFKWVLDQGLVKLSPHNGLSLEGSLVDITERKGIEAKLRTQMIFLEKVVDNLQVAFYAKDPDGKYLLANSAWSDIFHLDKSNFIGKTDLELLPVEFAESNIKSDYKAKDLDEVYRFEQDIYTAGKKTTWLRAKFTIKDQLNNIIAICSIGTEITDLKETQQELTYARQKSEEATLAKSEFLANMSHEIRTPLNAIIGFGQILEMNELGPDQKRYVQNITIAGKTLLTIINDILDLSKIEAGKLELVLHQVNLPTILNDIQSIFSEKFSEKGIEFSVVYDKNIPDYIFVDEIRLRQILINLISNAVKFTENGHIKISVKRGENLDSRNGFKLLIDVEDSGIGIPPEELSHLFKSFSQVSGQNHALYGGTGLGLSICQKLTQLMGGNITVESTLNKGSIFSLNIEALLNEVVEQKTFSVIPKIERNNRLLKVLVVDDVQLNRQLIISALKNQNIVLTEAGNGLEAIEEVKKNTPDIILMDMRMPTMSGHDAALKIKADERFKNIPIIAITASVLPEDEKLYRSICDDFMRKPINIEDLNQLINKFYPR